MSDADTGTILERLNRVFRDVLLDDMELTAATVAPDVPGWDSLSHILLMMAVEESFGIRFDLGDVEQTRNVGELCNLIARKTQPGRLA